ncbi:DgyrCDS3002 [Dimorphilus gyrociliatus]|uniref:DgyrCDS3002 n=1 Tax=Dimorphilus gyrociliatus TaxID=2664684 RepID=A0A7I8VGZ8_9ANNE|nr:DgyrCDS3002 [Dimorphilus gyrociliatus]
MHRKRFRIVEYFFNITFCNRNILEEAKEVQKLRERQKGVSAEDLVSTRPSKEVKRDTKDTFKIKTGGMVDMKNIKVNDDDIEAIGNNFAAETNRRDEDADMLKYVETELRKRKGEEDDNDSPEKRARPEDALYALPDNIKNVTNSKKTEDMLSNQMLSGIPEIELGIEAKIKNIEATEIARQKLMKEKRKKTGSDVSEFVPTNMAVNFVQHNRFNIEDDTPILKQQGGEPTREATHRKGPNTKGPTDNYHFTKFKNQMRP